MAKNRKSSTSKIVTSGLVEPVDADMDDGVGLVRGKVGGKSGVKAGAKAAAAAPAPALKKKKSVSFEEVEESSEDDSEADTSDDSEFDEDVEGGLSRVIELLGDDVKELEGMFGEMEGEGEEEEEEEEEEEDEEEDESEQEEEEEEESDASASTPHAPLPTPPRSAPNAVLQKLHARIETETDFFDTLSLVHETGDTELDPNDDLARELAFYQQALQGAKAAQAKFAAADVPFARPDDYFAEMVKSDAHMAKVRQTLLDESASIKASEDARKQRELKKFGKQVQHERLKERQQEKRSMNDKLDSLKKKRKRDGVDLDHDFDVDLEDALQTHKKPKKTPESQRGKVSRSQRDSKYGHPTSSRRPKENNFKTDFKPARGGGGRGGRGGARGGRGGRGGARGAKARPGKSRRK